MTAFARLFRAAEQKVSRAFSLHMGLPGPRWSPRNYTSFSKEAYKQNVIAYSAVNRLANAVSAIEWEVTKGDKVVSTHPLLDLLRKPNPMQSGQDWWRSRIGYLMLSGNEYLEKVSAGRNGIPTEIWPLRPDRMQIIPSRTGMPAGFVYKYQQAETRFEADPSTGESDILHTKLFNPLDDWYGMSPIEAMAYAIDQHNGSMAWMQSMLDNSARPSGALISDKDNPLSDEEFARLKTEIETQYSGASNAGRPMLLEGGLDWKEMGLSPMDMEILKVREASARDVSLAFGVPPLLLNIPGDNTYANYREARLGFYEDTVLPLVNFIISRFNIWHGLDEQVRPNKDKIEAIADKRTKLWEMADNSADITVNESRELKGYPPLPEPLGSMLMADVKKGTKEPAEDEPPTEDVAKYLQRIGYGPAR